MLKWVWILCVFIANYFWNIWFDIFELYLLEQRSLGFVFTPTRLIGRAWACPWQMGVQDQSRREQLLWVWEKRKEESEVWDKGSVWIELIFAKIENWNWKHCREIIFKCVNNTVGPIFNEKVAEKCNLWVREQYTEVLFTEDLVNNCGLEKKKKKRKRKTQKEKTWMRKRVIQTLTRRKSWLGWEMNMTVGKSKGWAMMRLVTGRGAHCVRDITILPS